MALVALASAKGSPGVTTAAVGLASIAPGRPIVADLDPAGGDLGLRYRTPESDPLDADRGLLSLGVAVRRGGNTEVEPHLQTMSGGLEALVGVASPGQVHGLGPTWPQIASSLQGWHEGDVYADCGRVAPGSASIPVLERADAAVFLVHPTVEGMSHLRERLRGLADVLRLGAVDGVPVGVAVVTDARDRRSAEDAQRLLESSGLPVRAVGVVARDPRAAEALRTGHGGRVRRSLLLRSMVDVATGVRDLMSAAHSNRQAML
ncbi:MAG TPA: hypothetical protein VNP20_16535 [Nocardioidaceae bacterium]|nr:hypothetical protein [Nocardioidaceae bacterium]